MSQTLENQTNYKPITVNGLNFLEAQGSFNTFCEVFLREMVVWGMLGEVWVGGMLGEVWVASLV